MRHIALVTLVVDDYDEAIRFYTEALGFRLVEDSPRPDGSRWVVVAAGDQGTAQLLILSQVILSLQLSFAVIPLVMFTGDRRKMGEFVNARWLKVLAWSTAVVIAGLNGWLLIQTAIA